MLKQFAAAALTLAISTGAALAQTSSTTSPTPAPATPPAASKSTAPTAQPAQPGAKTATPAKAAAIDINTATAKELAAKLPGLGEQRAEAIVKGRPYKGTDELVQKKIVPDAVYAQIKNQITVKQN